MKGNGTEKAALNGHDTWFKDARFGMFIHWGLYALPGLGEWQRLTQKIPHEEYEALADQFNPTRFNARAWARLARQAGAQYVVLTTRHHDGFSLFDSQVSDFTSVKRGPRRDFVAEFTDAVRAEGLRVGLYYSLSDWRYPSHRGLKLMPRKMDALREYVFAQVRELMTNYGKVDLVWFDGGFAVSERGIAWDTKEAPQWHGAELIAMMKQLQPGLVVNDRALVPADYVTCEQVITPPKNGELWESCMTLNDNWGYHRYDQRWKPTWQVLQNLLLCAYRGGSYLLNIGPKPDGSIPAPSVRRFRDLGAWMADHGEAIFGTQATDMRWEVVSLRYFTRADHVRYMFEPVWPGPVETIRNFPHTVRSARLLKSGKRLKVKQEGDKVTFSGLGETPDDALMSVIKIEIEER